ncbi:MAG TPA: STAS domain-containing protein [Noviherbaspirillum sp.]|nr:STAS domain-containing protein [Noviherbaspirillum sp.]
MGIFSLFGKKEGQPEQPADKNASRAKRNNAPPLTHAGAAGVRPPSTKRDAQAARATALKIDAIESEMSSEFVSTTTQPLNTAVNSDFGPTTTKPLPPHKPALMQGEKPRAATAVQARPEAGATLPPMTPEMGTTTSFLLDGQTAVADIAAPSSEAAAVIEESAIMYANGQIELVEHMLQAAIAADNLGSVTRNAWWMLFDLYQITGKQQAFESLSMEYVNKFEMSPPGWSSTSAKDVPAGTSSGTTPMVPFSGKLDASSTKHIERIQKLAENYRTLRLEFNRVTEVDTAGCGLLLAVLNKLQKSGHDLILVGAPELANKIRAMLEVGRRDDTEESWLLLLELLRLLNREKEFEEVSIDYCVTFEVSPPAFVAPQNKVTTAIAEATAASPADSFMMPSVVEGRIDNLIVSIASYSDEHNPAIIDCSRLMRVDFSAAGRLLTGLAPFCGIGKVIEFHHVNYLIAELFNVIGLSDIVRIVPRKN